MEGNTGKRDRACTIILSVSLLVIGAVACNPRENLGKRTGKTTASIDPPPAPDFSNPVDYVSWCVGPSTTDDARCARDVYPFLFEADSGSTFEPEKKVSIALGLAAAGPWASSESPELASYLAMLEPYIAAYVRGSTEKDVRWYCGESTWWPDSSPNYIRTRVLPKAVLAKAWMDPPSLDDAATRVLDASATNFRYARHIGQASIMAYFLVNNAIRSLNYHVLRKAMDVDSEPGRTASAILDMLSLLDATPDLAQAIRCDWSGVLDLLQQLYPGGSFSDTAAKRLKQNKYLPPGGIMLPSPEKTAARLNEWMPPFIKAAMAPWSVETYRKLDAYVKQRSHGTRGNLFLSIYLPAPSRPYLLAMAIERERRGTIVSAAIHAYKSEHDRWPVSLSELDDVVPATRIDPFSEREFRYELRDGQPWLYSLGLDQTDNGGSHDPRAGTSDRKTGHDIVFLPYQEDK